MYAKTLQLAFHGLDNHDEVWIRSVLNIALTRLKHHWVLSNQEQAQVLISYPACLPDIQRRRDHVLVMIQKDDDHPIPGTLVLPQPLRSTSFLQLLNRCGDELHQQASAPSRAVAANEELSNDEVAHSLSADFVLPEYLHWVNDVHQAMAAEQDVAIIVGDEPCYVINGRTRRMAALCAAVSPLRPSYLVHQWAGYSDEELNLWRVAPYTLDAELLSLPAERWWLIDSLFWHFGIKCSLQERLMQPPSGLSFRLWRWPDFGEIGVGSDEPDIAAALSAAFLRPNELTQLANTKPIKVQRFLQAALICNYLLQQADAASDSQNVDLALNDENKSADPATHSEAKESSLGILGVIRSAFNLKR